MAINRFNVPANQPVVQTYVPKPFMEIYQLQQQDRMLKQQQEKAKQDQENKLLEEADKLKDNLSKDLFGNKALTAVQLTGGDIIPVKEDNEILQGFQKTVLDNIDNATTELMSGRIDPRQYNTYLRNVGEKVKQFNDSPEVRNINQKYNTYQEYQKQIAAATKNPTRQGTMLEADRQLMYLANPQSIQTGVPSAVQIADWVDVNEEARKSVRDIKANTLRQSGFDVPDSEAEFTTAWERASKTITPKQINDAFRLSWDNSQMASATLRDLQDRAFYMQKRGQKFLNSKGVEIKPEEWINNELNKEYNRLNTYVQTLFKQSDITQGTSLQGVPGSKSEKETDSQGNEWDVMDLSKNKADIEGLKINPDRDYSNSLQSGFVGNSTQTARYKKIEEYIKKNGRSPEKDSGLWGTGVTKADIDWFDSIDKQDKSLPRLSKTNSLTPEQQKIYQKAEKALGKSSSNYEGQVAIYNEYLEKFKNTGTQYAIQTISDPKVRENMNQQFFGTSEKAGGRAKDFTYTPTSGKEAVTGTKFLEKYGDNETYTKTVTQELGVDNPYGYKSRVVRVYDKKGRVVDEFVASPSVKSQYSGQDKAMMELNNIYQVKYRPDGNLKTKEGLEIDYTPVFDGDGNKTGESVTIKGQYKSGPNQGKTFEVTSDPDAVDGIRNAFQKLGYNF